MVWRENTAKEISSNLREAKAVIASGSIVVEAAVASVSRSRPSTAGGRSTVGLRVALARSLKQLSMAPRSWTTGAAGSWTTEMMTVGSNSSGAEALQEL